MDRNSESEENRAYRNEAARELGSVEDEAASKAKLGAPRQQLKGDVPNPPSDDNLLQLVAERKDSPNRCADHYVSALIAENVMQTRDHQIAILTDAIKRAVPVGFVSSQHERKFCPQILGTKNGDWHVFGWQYQGQTSADRKLPDWRCIELHDIQTDIHLLLDPWDAGVTKGIGQQTCVDYHVVTIDPAYGPRIQNTSPSRTLRRGPARTVQRTPW